MGQKHQYHLCCCLENTSPRLALTSTSAAATGCSIPTPEELVPVSPCSCLPRGLQLFHPQVNFTSQDRACQGTFNFHSQVTSPLKNVLASALLAFTHKLPRCCLHPIRESLPLWHGFLLWHSHPALASLLLPPGATAGRPLLAWFCSLHGAVAAQLLPIGATRPA